MTSNSMPPSQSPARSERPWVSAAERDRDGQGGAAAIVSRALYNSAWYPIFPAALLLSGGYTAPALRQRLGRSAGLANQAQSRLRIWLHAASVGEIEAVRPVVLGLLEQLPGAALIVTTMTQTGCKAALRRIPGAAACRLAPLDHPLTVRAHLGAVAPHLVLIAEAELWPNYFLESWRCGAQVALVNGRVSIRSANRYRLLRPLWSAALRCADLLLVQTDDDGQRFLALGAPKDRIVVTGNTKFGPLDDDTSDGRPDPALRSFVEGNPTLIAGSTGPGEEQLLIQAWTRLRDRFERLRMVLAPRHLERLGEVEQSLRKSRIAYARATALKAGAESGEARILLLDTMGDLRLLYRCGTLAFVGGSLFEGRGGQNLGEPAAAGIPVLFGPFHHNQLQIAQALLACGAGVVVRDAEDISNAVSGLLGDDQLLHCAGASARGAYQSLAGGAARSVAELRKLISST